ncbi:MAG: cytidine deaminase [Prolixibacteraceae bacterium]|nr:cytidine deaminase [Prolixibacteraceae bacterium]
MKQKNIQTKIEIHTFDELPAEYRQLIETAKEQTQKSYSPYSHYKVGSAVLLENGVIVGGNNQENAAYPSGLCAERVAAFYAGSQYPETAILAIAVAAFHNGDFTYLPVHPCGACLQVLLENEFRGGKDIKLILYGKKEVQIVNSIKECLPLYFNFQEKNT